MSSTQTYARAADETGASPGKFGPQRTGCEQSTTQANGKKERWYETLKRECLRPNTPLSLEDARRLVAQFVAHYNHARLHAALGYVAPAD
jgi:transposase InsO family protein